MISKYKLSYKCITFVQSFSGSQAMARCAWSHMCNPGDNFSLHVFPVYSMSFTLYPDMEERKSLWELPGIRVPDNMTNVCSRSPVGSF